MIILYFAVLIVGFYFLLVRPQRKQMAARRALVAAVQLGDEVVTAGGIHGRVAFEDGDIVGLEIAPDVVIRIARGAISARPGAVDAAPTVDADEAPPALDAGDADLDGEATEDDGEA